MPAGPHIPSTFLVTGPVGRAVWSLAWPTILTNVLQTSYGFVNLIFVGSLGKASIAAVAFANSALFWQFAALLGVMVGNTALVSRSTGAGNPKDAEIATRQSLLLALAGAVLTAVPMILLHQGILSVLGAEPQVITIAAPYLNVCLYASPLFFLSMVLASSLRGIGDTRTPLIAMGVQVALNVLGDWVLIFGVGPFPALGVTGAAWATLFSRVASLAVLGLLFTRTPLAGALRGPYRVDWGWMKRILNIGLPATAQAVLRTTGSSVYQGIVARTVEGTTAVAALSIGIQAESLAFMPGFAFGVAATAMVGQNLGAGQPARARRAGWLSMVQGMIIMSAMGVLFFLLAQPFSRLISQEADVVALGAAYLMINAPSEPFLAMAMVLTGALNGAGQTRVPAVLTFLSLWVLRLPMTWLLALHLSMGATGAWISMAVTTGLGGLFTAAYYKWGRWAATRV